MENELFDYKELLASPYDIDEIALDLENIEKDIHNTIKAVNDYLENKDPLYFNDPLHQKAFFETMIRLYYLRNELAPYFVCLTQTERDKLVLEGHSFSQTRTMFSDFKQLHQFIPSLNDDHLIFIQYSLNLNHFVKMQVEGSRLDVDIIKEKVVDRYLKKNYVWGIFDHQYVANGMLSFEEYVKHVELKPIASLREQFDEMVTFKHSPQIKLYTLAKIRDVYVTSKLFLVKTPKLVDALDNSFFNVPTYRSPRTENGIARYVVFMPYKDLSAKMVYEYFYLISDYLFSLFSHKIKKQFLPKVVFKSEEKEKKPAVLSPVFQSDVVRNMVFTYGHDIYLDFYTRHYKDETIKSVVRFDQSLVSFIGNSIKQAKKWNTDKASKASDVSFIKALKKCHDNFYDEIQGAIKYRQKNDSKTKLDQIDFSFERNWFIKFNPACVELCPYTQEKNEIDIDAIEAMIYLYLIEIIEAFYTELKLIDQLDLKDQIKVVKGQFFHIGFLLYCIEETLQCINEASFEEAKHKISKKTYHDMMKEKLKDGTSIQSWFNRILKELRYAIYPTTKENPFLRKYYDKKKNVIPSYYNLLLYYKKQFANEKSFYKLSFANNNTRFTFDSLTRYIFDKDKIVDDLMDINTNILLDIIKGVYKKNEETSNQ